MLDTAKVAQHRFLPLMAFEKRDRKYRRQDDGTARVEFKIRKIAYSSNIDSCIFSYYAHLLHPEYEKILEHFGIEDAVIGYRSVGSNIDLALQAFREIETRGPCVAFAFDISGFFDNIDHGVLKRNWCRVMKCAKLPDDHYHVFRNLTKYSSVNKSAVLRRLGISPATKDRDISLPLCSMGEFRSKIKGENTEDSNLIWVNKKSYGIPQGTAISAIAANISMIEFDLAMKFKISSLGGSYRRYSDDILIIVPAYHRADIEEIMGHALKIYTRNLKIKPSKTEIVEFSSTSILSNARPLQYLGFQFTGSKILIRPNTISKFYRRMRKTVAKAFVSQKKVIEGKLNGRRALQKRAIYADLTHLGHNNFVTSYAKQASKKMSSHAIRRQMAGHMKKIHKLLSL